MCTLRRRFVHYLFALILACCAMALPAQTPAPFPPADQKILDEIELGSFLFFWKEADPRSGLAPDKTGVRECSVAGVGFGLAALPVGIERGFITRQQGEARALTILRTLDASDARHAGVFAHFIDIETGKTTPGGYEHDASTIDTALLIAGALTAGEYFKGETERLANKIYGQVNWRAFVNAETNLVRMAWKPKAWNDMEGEGEFSECSWDHYTDETLLIALLGISAPNTAFRLAPEAMTNWLRPVGRYKGEPFIYTFPGTLFTYTFAQCFIDFRRAGKDTLGTDWFQNTVEAVKANRDWCRDHASKFATYGQDRWGITAGSGPDNSYIVPGCLPCGNKLDNPEGGTLHPYGAAMALPFLPGEAMAALRQMRDFQVGGRAVWKDPAQGGYGFADGFNVDRNWIGDQVFAVAQGPMLLLVENARSGLVWDYFMAHPAIKAGLLRAGFKGPLGIDDPGKGSPPLLLTATEPRQGLVTIPGGDVVR